MAFSALIANCEAKLGTWVSSGPDAGSKGCVAAVKALTNAPQTGLWRRGEKVRGNNSILPGTAIATFPVVVSGQYRFKGHAAIFIRNAGNGILVYDQWDSSDNPELALPLHKRTIPYACAGYVSNDADAFFVIELTEYSSTEPALCGRTSHYERPR